MDAQVERIFAKLEEKLLQEIDDMGFELKSDTHKLTLRMQQIRNKPLSSLSFIDGLPIVAAPSAAPTCLCL